MKLKKLFKEFDIAMSKRRKVEIYLYDEVVFTGIVSDIPDDLKDKVVRTWCNMLEVNPIIQDRCCDEDVNSINVEMVLTVFLIDEN